MFLSSRSSRHYLFKYFSLMCMTERYFLDGQLFNKKIEAEAFKRLYEAEYTLNCHQFHNFQFMAALILPDGTVCAGGTMS